MAANVRNLCGDYAGSELAASRAQKLVELGFGPEPDWALYWNIGYTAVVRRDWERAGMGFAKSSSLQGRDPAVVRAYRELFSGLAAIERRAASPAEKRSAQIRLVEKYDRLLQPQIMAMVYLQLGDKERMYALMERDPKEIFYITGFYDSIRNEPRFIALSKKRPLIT